MIPILDGFYDFMAYTDVATDVLFLLNESWISQEELAIFIEEYGVVVGSDNPVLGKVFTDCANQMRTEKKCVRYNQVSLDRMLKFRGWDLCSYETWRDNEWRTWCRIQAQLERMCVKLRLEEEITVIIDESIGRDLDD